MYNSSKHKKAEGGKPVIGPDDVVGSFELMLESLWRISPNKIDKSLDFLIMEDVFLLSRNKRGCRVEISDDKINRDWRRLRSERFGETKELADGRRFLGGKDSDEIKRGVKKLNKSKNEKTFVASDRGRGV
ncbi:hypothetical protein K7X08_016035 [Anisodus acutangulus]|uniref:Uncharacterized protein n=1 Tax=Anisodus acutangulus TaxID=402998 RepID=A0A9Q1LCS8_9SOLA|nr:hypothetical protein K7X08_016035 [Anisodus acutangulus]